MSCTIISIPTGKHTALVLRRQARRFVIAITFTSVDGSPPRDLVSVSLERRHARELGEALIRVARLDTSPQALLVRHSPGVPRGRAQP